MEEQKAYDPKALIARYKAKGIDVAEELVSVLVEETFGWLGDSAVASSNKVDDFLAPFYPQVNAYVQSSLVDKIDGEDDESR